MHKPIHIVILGTGNVSSHLAAAIQKNKALKLVQAFNHRASKTTKKFSQQFHCEMITEISRLKRDAGFYIIAVKDDAIEEIAAQLASLKLPGTVLHTSGSVDMAALKKVSAQTGVLYPLQTFYKGAVINWETTPLLIEANSKKTLAHLQQFAQLISGNVTVVNSANRLKVHLAAVFANNFTNAMYVSAYELIEKSLGKKHTALLGPIMKSSFQKLETVHPKDAQTGPAMRKDKSVMKKHVSILKKDNSLSAIYKLLSELIIKQQTKK